MLSLLVMKFCKQGEKENVHPRLEGNQTNVVPPKWKPNMLTTPPCTIHNNFKTIFFRMKMPGSTEVARLSVQILVTLNVNALTWPALHFWQLRADWLEARLPDQLVQEFYSTRTVRQEVEAVWLKLHLPQHMCWPLRLLPTLFQQCACLFSSLFWFR